MPTLWDNSFAPEEIQVLSTAFERAWSFIEKSGDLGTDPPDYCRSNLAIHIMAVAQMGEKDPFRLANNAIRRYREQQAQRLASAARKFAGGSAGR